MNHPFYIDYNLLDDNYEVYTPIQGELVSLGSISLEQFDSLVAGLIEYDYDIYVRFDGMPTFLQIWPDSTSME